MNFSKLKLEQFTTYNGFHMPESFNPPLIKDEKPEVYFLFVRSIKDVMDSINLAQNHQIHTNNRLFFVFQKGNKNFNRDHIYNIVMRHKNLKRKAPILSSLDEKHSVFAFMIEIN